MEQHIDTTIFKNITLVGRGGMAAVYKAVHKESGQLVAIKVLDVESLPPLLLAKAIKRFEREAQVYQALQHPNIVKILDFHSDPKNPYLVMEYLEGGTLKSQMGRAVEWRKFLTTLLPIGKALQHIHDNHLVHRDFKPSNILLTPEGTAKLADFGVVQILDHEDESSLTETNRGVGTPEYMAPEQWNGHTTPLSDQYAFGVVLYEGLTGHKPFTANTAMGVLLRQSTESIPGIRTYAKDIPPGLEKIVIKSMSLNPNLRYRNMEILTTDLEALLNDGKPITPRRPISLPIRDLVKKIPLPHTRLLVFVLVLCFSLLALFLFSPMFNATALPFLQQPSWTPTVSQKSAPLLSKSNQTPLVTAMPLVTASPTPTVTPTVTVKPVFVATQTPTRTATPAITPKASRTQNPFNEKAALGAPPAPAKFTGICGDAKRIYMRWYGSGTEWGFNLYRNGVFIYQSGPGFQEYFDKNELYEQYINYVLRAYNGSGQSEPVRITVLGCKK